MIQYVIKTECSVYHAYSKKKKKNLPLNLPFYYWKTRLLFFFLNCQDQKIKEEIWDHAAEVRESLTPVSVVYLRGLFNRRDCSGAPDSEAYDLKLLIIIFMFCFFGWVIVYLICCAVFNNHLIYKKKNYFMPLIVLYSVRGQDHWLS